MYIIAALLYFVFAVTLGAHCADYILWAVAGQDISFWGDAAIGLIASSVIVPTAIVLWVAGAFGLIYPLITQ